MLFAKLDIVSKTFQWNKLGNSIDSKEKHLINAYWCFLFKFNTTELLPNHFSVTLESSFFHSENPGS